MKTSCPYCGADIDNDIEQCPNCNEYFKEPYLKNFKCTSIWLFFIMDALLSGFFTFIWILMNKNAFKNISSKFLNKKMDDLYRWIFLNLSLMLVCAFFIPLFTIILYVLNFVLFVMLSDLMILIIQRYTKKKYKVEITHNSIFEILFRTLYVVHYIETYKLRVLYPKKSNFLFVPD